MNLRNVRPVFRAIGAIAPGIIVIWATHVLTPFEGCHIDAPEPSQFAWARGPAIFMVTGGVSYFLTSLRPIICGVCAAIPLSVVVASLLISDPGPKRKVVLAVAAGLAVLAIAGAIGAELVRRLSLKRWELATR